MNYREWREHANRQLRLQVERDQAARAAARRRRQRRTSLIVGVFWTTIFVMTVGLLIIFG